MPNPRIKDEKVYESLRREGASKEKAARIANASAKEGRSTIGKRGGNAENLEDRTVKELKERAKELDIKGFSKLKKNELVQKIRNH